MEKKVTARSPIAQKEENVKTVLKTFLLKSTVIFIMIQK